MGRRTDHSSSSTLSLVELERRRDAGSGQDGERAEEALRGQEGARVGARARRRSGWRGRPELEKIPKMEEAGVETSTVAVLLSLLSLLGGGGIGGAASARGMSFTSTEVSTSPQKRKRPARRSIANDETQTRNAPSVPDAPSSLSSLSLSMLAFRALPSNRILCRCAHVYALASFEQSTRECEWTVGRSRL
jgi:hypothetical protein